MCLFTSLWLAVTTSILAEDFYWTNQITGNFTNAPNWVTNSLSVTLFPTDADNVFFTNNIPSTVNWTATVTNANANFSNGTLTQAIGSATWLITNNYLISPNLSDTTTVLHSSGTLVVTNGGGTATLHIGQNGRGVLTLTGGTIVADRIIATNSTSTTTNSVFNFKYGTLRTLNGTTIGSTLYSNSFSIGTTAGQIGRWEVLGGTNTILNPSIFPYALNIGNGGIGQLVEAGTSTYLSTSWRLVVGGSLSSSSSMLVISNGARLDVGDYMTVGAGGSTNNIVLVTDSNSLLRPINQVDIGSVSPRNILIVSNGGKVWLTSTFNSLNIGASGGGSNNLVLVTDSGSILTNQSPLAVGSGSGTGNNRLVVTNGGSVYNTSGIIGSSSGSNSVFITGNGSKWYNTLHMTVGSGSSSNLLTIANGGSVRDTTGFVGSSSTSYSNAVLVTGSGAIWTNTLTLTLNGSASEVMITNGGSVHAPNVRVGFNTGSSGNIYITGSNSLLRAGTSLAVGTNASSSGTGMVLVTQSGTLEATNLISGFAGTGVITNTGGIFQFTHAAPVITTNDPNSIVLTNGTISYRAVAAADIFNSQVSNITFQGDNTFQLNASTNSSISSYTFGTNNGNLYQHLSLVNGSTRWQSTVASTIGSGGILSISNTTAVVAGLLTNSGAIHVYFSRVTYSNPVIIANAYLSDPSTNIFTTNVTIASTGYLQGGAGDLFQFERNLTLQSTASNLFNLSASTVLFTNLGGAHILDLTGSSALDRGTNGIVQLANVTNDFALGTLMIAEAGDTLRVTGDVANALYVGALNLGSLANTNNLITDVNVYYDNTLVANAYLGSATYDLQGAGMLIPFGVPEPASMMILLFGTAGFLARHRSRKSHPQAAKTAAP